MPPAQYTKDFLGNSLNWITKAINERSVKYILINLGERIKKKKFKYKKKKIGKLKVFPDLPDKKINLKKY